MITIVSEIEGIAKVYLMGVEAALVHYVRTYGPIIGLDRWAHDHDCDPFWTRICAHSAAAKGLLKLTRLEDKSGRPYRVSALEEETPCKKTEG